MLLDSLDDVRYFLSGLNSSSEIKFDTAELLYSNTDLDYFNFINNVSNHENLLYFFDVNINVNASITEFKFAFYLQKKL